MGPIRLYMGLIGALALPGIRHLGPMWNCVGYGGLKSSKYSPHPAHVGEVTVKSRDDVVVNF